jgi:tetratricopeptide (TPR) repeat protein
MLRFFFIFFFSVITTTYSIAQSTTCNGLENILDIYKAQNYEKVIEIAAKAIKQDSLCTEAYTYRGVGYSELGQYAEAIDDLSKAIKIDPKNSKAYRNIAIVWYKL